jgi:hypothetical protein
MHAQIEKVEGKNISSVISDGGRWRTAADGGEAYGGGRRGQRAARLGGRRARRGRAAADDGRTARV